MHRIAEQGVAAHWKYKDGRAETASSPDDQRIIWMRHLIEWVQEMQEPSEFLSTLRVDLYPEEVYTFTPKGRVVVLPRGATPIDFAYAVHTEVGHQCAGAKVNGEMVPLRHALANGDVVEIVTQKGHTPSRDWLAFVHTSRARSKIRQWIHLHERQEATEVGRRLLEKEARNAGVSLKKIPEEDLQRVASEYGCCARRRSIRRPGLRQMVRPPGDCQGHRPDPCPEAAEEEKQPKIASTVKRMLGIDDAAILVRGHGDLMVYRSKCCNPIPGDDIVGYVTRGRGIAVHSKICPNVENLLYEAERRIPVEWAGIDPSDLPRAAADFHRRPPGHARRNHRHHQRNAARTSAPSKAAARTIPAPASKWPSTFATASSSSRFSPASSAFPAFSISSASTTSESYVGSECCMRSDYYVTFAS